MEVEPILVWRGIPKRLEVPQPYELFDIIKPLPTHPHYDKLLADKIAGPPVKRKPVHPSVKTALIIVAAIILFGLAYSIFARHGV